MSRQYWTGFTSVMLPLVTGLSTQLALFDGVGTELAVPGYARKNCTLAQAPGYNPGTFFSDLPQLAAQNFLVGNNADVTFGPFTNATNVWGAYLAVNNTTVMASSRFTSAKTIAAGQTLVIPAFRFTLLFGGFNDGG